MPDAALYIGRSYDIADFKKVWPRWDLSGKFVCVLDDMSRTSTYNLVTWTSQDKRQQSSPKRLPLELAGQSGLHSYGLGWNYSLYRYHPMEAQEDENICLWKFVSFLTFSLDQELPESPHKSPSTPMAKKIRWNVKDQALDIFSKAYLQQLNRKVRVDWVPNKLPTSAYKANARL